MLNFGILLKSYDKDFDLAERLIESFNRYNPEKLQMFVVVPETDVEQFQIFSSDTITVLSESLLGEYLVDHEVAGIRPGYINQEVVKLAFWELGLTENYFCVDSDAVFIRPLSIDDFMFDDSTPYTVLVEDNELKSEPGYFEQHWKGRELQLRKIQQLVGLNDRRILTCHGHQIFSSIVLSSLRNDFMHARSWSYVELLEEAPYEFSWYNMWLQKSKAIPIEIREPLVKTFHNRLHQIQWAAVGINVESAKRGYIGVVVNSNFDRESSKIGLSMPDHLLLSRQFRTRTLLKAIRHRLLS